MAWDALAIEVRKGSGERLTRRTVRALEVRGLVNREISEGVEYITRLDPSPAEPEARSAGGEAPPETNAAPATVDGQAAPEEDAEADDEGGRIIAKTKPAEPAAHVLCGAAGVFANTERVTCDRPALHDGRHEANRPGLLPVHWPNTDPHAQLAAAAKAAGLPPADAQLGLALGTALPVDGWDADAEDHQEEPEDEQEGPATPRTPSARVRPIRTRRTTQEAVQAALNAAEGRMLERAARAHERVWRLLSRPPEAADVAAQLLLELAPGARMNGEVDLGHTRRPVGSAKVLDLIAWLAIEAGKEAGL